MNDSDFQENSRQAVARQGEPPKDTRWKPGQSGNPKGRKAGSRLKILVDLDEQAEAAAKDIVKAMIEKAKGGDAVAARTLLERVWPPRKGARLQFDLPAVRKADELPTAISAINQQVAEGDLSPDEGALVVGLLEAQRKAIETSELAARVAALEERMAPK
ncbi:DUF5681 domain-containing protein [Mesorhizobium sp. 1B3]|uniref:DUF5681 domain-containing protein n=1 Tax=Mesorhizobium sp. 1B3 TaxID=3243599 RepID=UPI003D97D0DE